MQGMRKQGEHEHKIEITAPDGRKYVAYGFTPFISIDSEPVEVTCNGIFGGPADFMRRFVAGPQTLRVEMRVCGKVETVEPAKQIGEKPEKDVP